MKAYNLLNTESFVVKTVFLFPSLMVPPISPGLCSGISITLKKNSYSFFYILNKTEYLISKAHVYKSPHVSSTTSLYLIQIGSNPQNENITEIKLYEGYRKILTVLSYVLMYIILTDRVLDRICSGPKYNLL